MKLIALERNKLDQHIAKVCTRLINQGKRSYQMSESRIDELEFILSLLITAAYYQKESGFVSFPRNRNSKKNIRKLCNGKMIDTTPLEHMPFIFPTAIYDQNIITTTRKNTFLELGILKRRNISKNNKQVGGGAEHYYQLTKQCQCLIPTEPKFKRSLLKMPTS